MLSIGIDFGTTNSCIAVISSGRDPVSVQFQLLGEPTQTYRSILYFQRDEKVRSRVHRFSGSEAIERYLEDDEKGRLIQSIKSLLGSSSFTSTSVFGKAYRAEELVATFLRALFAAAGGSTVTNRARIVVGRPVHFVGAESEADDEMALKRMRDAFAHVGITDFAFEHEPIAAALTYEHTLDRDETVLIGDFGGGTSDFSLLRLGPGMRNRPDRILANVGLPLAGDAFDTRIIRHVVSPLLGLNSEYRSFGKSLPVPSWFYSRLERWHYLSLLKNRETIETLRAIERTADHPDRIAALTELIEGDLGFRLHQAVQHTKIQLSHKDRASFRFDLSSFRIHTEVLRRDFEEWIAEDLALIDRSITEVLERAEHKPEQVDRVYLTGGTCFVPAVRRIFARRFGDERLTSGDNFTSVATGLALAASQLQKA